MGNALRYLLIAAVAGTAVVLLRRKAFVSSAPVEAPAEPEAPSAPTSSAGVAPADLFPDSFDRATLNQAPAPAPVSTLKTQAPAPETANVATVGDNYDRQVAPTTTTTRLAPTTTTLKTATTAPTLGSYSR